MAYPTGAAVSPDGKRILTIAGRVFQTAQSPSGPSVELRVIDATTGATLQALHVGDAFQSVAYSPDGSSAYVAGGSDNVVHAYGVDAAGLLQSAPDLAVPGCQFVSGLAVAPDGSALWAACSLSDTVAELALPSGQVLRQASLSDPDQIALSPGGRTAYVTDWRGAVVYAVGAATGVVRRFAVGAEPEGLAVLADGRVVVADSNDATMATITPSNGAVERTSLGIVGAGRGTDAPVDVAAAPDGRVYVSLAAENAVVVLAPHQDGSWRLAGLIPTAWDPTAVALGPGGRRLEVVSGLGLGHSAATTVPYVSPDPAALAADGAYLTVGTLQTLATPAGVALAADTVEVRRETAAWKTTGPLPTALGPRSPIHHVIYVTRENKTYDSELGDLHPGPGAALATFGATVTPNMHLIATQFADATRFYFPAFASTTGHMWEDAGGPNDVFLRAVSDPALDNHWSDPTNYPLTGLLTEQAWAAGLSVRAYDEELAQRSGLLPYAYQASPAVYPNYDLSIPDTTREAGWAGEFAQFAANHCSGALGATYGTDCQLPALEYVYLGGDHTTVVDEPGSPTIEAQVANTDYATAKLIQTVSRSRYWRSTLIVITEDDPQGTGDHISAYRGIVGLAGPYVRRGTLSTARYQWTSIVAAIDLILDLPPLTDAVAQARPLDTLFTNHPDFRPFTASTLGVTLYPWTPLPDAPVRIPAP
ncbi:MAG: bifunctional YncE family protein/alkaline phosphatase family protein [Acidimicrobiales bacterium]